MRQKHLTLTALSISAILFLQPGSGCDRTRGPSEVEFIIQRARALEQEAHW